MGEKSVRIIFKDQNPVRVGKVAVKSGPYMSQTLTTIAPSKAITRKTQIKKAVITDKIVEKIRFSGIIRKITPLCSS